jgi:hypothetical protein
MRQGEKTYCGGGMTSRAGEGVEIDDGIQMCHAAVESGVQCLSSLDTAARWSTCCATTARMASVATSSIANHLSS